ncbi:MAG: DUF5615 family PIN-like protein [Chloroflexota bacterium]
MNEIFIKLYLDEDVSVIVAELIRARGFAVLTTRDAGQRQKSDAEQLAFAISQGRAIVTHNRVDFETLAQKYYESGKEHYGIFIVVRCSPHEIARRLLQILNRVSSDEMMNQIRYI